MDLLYVGIIIALVLLLCTKHSKNKRRITIPVIESAKVKGSEGEKRVSNLLSLLPEEYIVYNDLIFRTDNGTTQIDHLVFSKHGIFAIETKNYTGEIYGDDTRKQWTQIISTISGYSYKWLRYYKHITKNNFYNPVKQAYGHVYRIKELLKNHPNITVIPIVVFVGNADLSKVKSSNHVITGEQLVPLITGYKNICLSNQEFISIYNILNSYNVRQIVDDETHVNNIKRVEQDYQNKILSGICPKCGGHLVLKKGKYGNFYGCSNYPNCKFTINQQDKCQPSSSNTQ